MRLGNIPKASDWKAEFGLEAFVETGCFRGQSLVDAAIMGFRDLYSCDTQPEYVSRCLELLPSATIHNAESHKFLQNVLHSVAWSRTMFWLDAHLPFIHGASMPEVGNYPLLEELRAIRNHKLKFERDVILCDDTNMIRKNNKFAVDGSTHNLQHCDDKIDFQDILHFFDDTHEVVEFPDLENGVTAFLPK